MVKNKNYQEWLLEKLKDHDEAVSYLNAAKNLERRFDVLKGKIKIAEDFDAPLSDEFLADFEA